MKSQYFAPRGYNVLSEAMSYYRTLGYQLVTVPWYVRPEFIEATHKGSMIGIPNTYDYFNHETDDHRVMVGSAEQSFLAVWDKLEIGKRYMALTPCMRNEDELGGFSVEECRLPGFMKLELFVKGQHAAESMRKSALRFFKTWIPTIYDIEVDRGWDIMTRGGLELGSYYDTRFKGEKYSCGTGLAWERLLHAQGIKVPNLWLS